MPIYSWSLSTRSVAAGYFAKSPAGLTGLRTRSPPQFGQVPWNLSAAQSLQKVHSNVHIIAAVESAGRSRSQFSQLGRISSIRKVALQSNVQPRFVGIQYVLIHKGVFVLMKYLPVVGHQCPDMHQELRKFVCRVSSAPPTHCKYIEKQATHCRSSFAKLFPNHQLQSGPGLVDCAYLYVHKS